MGNSPLVTALNDSRKQLRSHRKGDLPLGYRKQIWQLIGPRGKRRAKRVEKAHFDRYQLAKQSVVHVLPIWEKAFPDDDAPGRLLKISDAILEGSLSRKEVLEGWQENWTYFDDLSFENVKLQPAVMVGYAANQLLLVALVDERLPNDDSFDPTLDQDVEPEEFDAAFLASIAAASGATWEKRSNATRRREFWAWWLGEVEKRMKSVVEV